MFVQLTHTRSGEKTLLRADTILGIREKDGKTLVTGDFGNGMYVDENASTVRNMVENTLISMNQKMFEGCFV